MTPLKQLTGILEEELLLYSRLLALIEEEREMLAAGRIMEMEEATHALDHVAAKVRALEESRVRAVERISAEYELEEQSLAALLQRLDAPDREPLERLGIQLRQLALEAETANQYNAYLIHESLEFIHKVYRDAARKLGDPETYESTGSRRKAALKPAVLDRRA